MTTVRGSKVDRKRNPHGVSGWQLLAALLLLGAVIVATLLITKSPGAVTIVTIPLVTVLGWWLRHPKEELKDEPPDEIGDESPEEVEEKGSDPEIT
jgi:hypothetical protein